MKSKQSKLYMVWARMRQRCGNPNASHYADYGGRGITVCADWEAFTVFATWAIPAGYGPGLQIDRVNPDGNYEPDNCRWITQQANKRNKRRHLTATAFGETKLLVEWAEDSRIGLSYRTLQMRYWRGGLRDEELLLRPKGRWIEEEC